MSCGGTREHNANAACISETVKTINNALVEYEDYEFFHGTRARLNIGDIIAPAAIVGTSQNWNVDGTAEWAFATIREDHAEDYAEASHQDGPARVYHVVPIEDVEPDPHEDSDGEYFRSRNGWRVIGWTQLEDDPEPEPLTPQEETFVRSHLITELAEKYYYTTGEYRSECVTRATQEVDANLTEHLSRFAAGKSAAAASSTLPQPLAPYVNVDGTVHPRRARFGKYVLVQENSAIIAHHEKADAQNGLGKRIGYVSWFPGDIRVNEDGTFDDSSNVNGGVIYKAYVSGPFRRKGFASAMLQFARHQNPDKHIRHSRALSDDGRAWAENTP